MSTFELEPFDTMIEDLLREERAAFRREEAPSAAKARVARRIELGVAGIAAAGAIARHAKEIAASSPSSAVPSAPLARAAVNGAAIATHVVAGSAAKRVVSIALAFAVGGGAGASAIRYHDAPVLAERAPSSTPPATVITPVPPAPRPTGPVLQAPASSASSPPEVAWSALPQAPLPPSAPSATASVAAEDLAAERVLLDEARHALLRGESEKAIAPLTLHAQRYPKGRLVEEREALLVQALARSGRASEAGERGARFQQKYPGSLFTTAVDDALSSISDN